MTILLDVAPSSGTIGGIVAVTFFLLLLAVAFVAYKALKKTAAMAVRMIIVAIILAIAVAGSISLWYFSGGGSPRLKAPPPRKAVNTSDRK